MLAQGFVSLEKVWLGCSRMLDICSSDCKCNSSPVGPCRLPAMASTTGNEAVELSSFASGTGKSSAERLKVIQVPFSLSQRSNHLMRNRHCHALLRCAG